jgi:hypothetical protein
MCFSKADATRANNQETAMNVHLVTVVGSYIDVLPHMLGHYKQLGVQSLIIHLHTSSCHDELIEKARSIVKMYDTDLASITVIPWSENINPLLYRMSQMKAPTDWFVLADQDELQRYPDTLFDALRYCEEKGYDYLEGAFVDRLSADGTLRPVTADESIWEQFPLGGCISGAVLGAVINKVVAAKGHVRIARGQHHAYSGRRCPPSELYIPVHHFKWVEGLIARLKARVEIYKRLDEQLWMESARFIEYYERKHRIDLADTRLLVGSCSPEYEHWETIRQWRLASILFRTF